MAIPKEYYQRAAELLRHDDATGELIWKENRGGFVKAGDIAGSHHHSGYTKIGITLNGKAKRIQAHRIVYFIHHGFIPEVIDHINGDGTDNRSCNLREATHSQNGANRRSAKGSKSRFLGVSWSKRSNKWSASIRFNNKSNHIGYYDSEQEAAKAYNFKAKEIHGEFARINQI